MDKSHTHVRLGERSSKLKENVRAVNFERILPVKTQAGLKKKKIKKSLTVKGEALSLIYPVQKGNVMLATSLKALLLHLKYELWLTHTTQIN